MYMKTHKLTKIIFYKDSKETKFTAHELRLTLHSSMEMRHQKSTQKKKFESTIF